jgi:hypothetical protein
LPDGQYRAAQDGDIKPAVTPLKFGRNGERWLIFVIHNLGVNGSSHLLCAQHYRSASQCHGNANLAMLVVAECQRHACDEQGNANNRDHKWLRRGEQSGGKIYEWIEHYVPL